MKVTWSDGAPATPSRPPPPRDRRLRALSIALSLGVSGGIMVAIQRITGLIRPLESNVTALLAIASAALLTGCAVAVVEPWCVRRPARAFALPVLIFALAVGTVAAHVAVFERALSGEPGALGRLLKVFSIAWPLHVGTVLAFTLALGVPLGIDAWSRARETPPSPFRRFLLVVALGVLVLVSAPVVGKAIPDKSLAVRDHPFLTVLLFAGISGPSCFLAGGPLVLLLALGERLVERARRERT